VTRAGLGVLVATILFAAGTAAGPAPAKTPAAPPAGPAAPKPADQPGPVTVDADRMESFGKESLVVFSGNVVARQDNSVQHADRMEVYLDEAGDRVTRTVSTGNVRIITRDCRTGTARRSEYYNADQRVELIGNARVWQDDNVVTGEQITIYLDQDRSVVQGGKQERVKAVFYPKSERRPTATADCGPGRPSTN
jgi:lipopolysaccharide export system protein LptA